MIHLPRHGAQPSAGMTEHAAGDQRYQECRRRHPAQQGVSVKAVSISG